MIGIACAPDARRFRADTYPFQLNMPFRQSDVDEFGHINNTAIATLHEDARRRLVDLLDLDGWSDRSLRVLAAQNVVHYLTEAHYPAEATCFAGVGEIRRSSVVVSTMIMSGGTCVSVADTVLVIRRGDARGDLRQEDRRVLAEWSLRTAGESETANTIS